MINNLRLKLLKFKVKYFEKFSRPEDFSNILRMEGIEIGKGTIFYSPNTQNIDRERPWMLKIGEYCKITRGTIILTHDYSRSVLRRAYGEVIGEAGITKIGNNVFIGMNSIILMGTNIGNNVIIGAGSVVSGNIPDNVVIAGNPAKIIRTLDEHYAIRKKKYINEAKLYAKSFYQKYKRKPNVTEMNAFFPLYLERSNQALLENKINIKLNGDCESEIRECFLNSKPVYNDFEEFIDDVFGIGDIINDGK